MTSRRRPFAPPTLALVFALQVSPSVTLAAEFNLRYVDHTATQIIVAWDALPEASSYRLERARDFGFAEDRIAYMLPATATGFGDSGWPTSDHRRFQRRSTPSDSPEFHLAAATDYYYRVTATTAAGDILSNIIGPHRIADFATFSEIERGRAGDVWADAILGQQRFGENTWWDTEPLRTQYGGGVLIDRNTSHPTRVFLIDGNHNRILGMRALGRCSSSQAECSIDADCDGDTCTLLPGEMTPSFVLGQPDSHTFGACNGDATNQVFPNRERATSSSLCFVRPDQISMAETVISIQAAVDADHNLYVPDDWNNRVLMYRDPFDEANGTAAAAVWGQADFDQNLCNRGIAGPPDRSSLCRPTSVDIDSDGNLWVVDSAENNGRVLRFRRDPVTGELGSAADIELTGLWHPLSVRVDPQGDVYVSDAAGLRKFTAPVPPGSNSSEVLEFVTLDPHYFGLTQFAFDPTQAGRLWAEISAHTHALLDLNEQSIVKKVFAGQFRGLDVSPVGDLFSVDAWDHHVGLYRLGPAQTDAEYSAGDVAFLGFGVPSARSSMAIIGITTSGNQLLVSDRYFVHFWNDFHAVTEGTDIAPPADGHWGPAHPSYLMGGGNSYIVKSDTSGRIWINDVSGEVKLFDAPLTATSAPTRTLTVSKFKNEHGNIVPLPSSARVHVRHFAPIGSGDRAWLADEEHARVLRLVNIDGQEVPGESPYVDIVLGQDDWNGSECNRGAGGLDFARDTLCSELRPSVDANGNLFVQDNSTAGMDGGDTRVLRWNADTIPQHPPETLFGILPDSVYGAGAPGNFTPTGSSCNFGETACKLMAVSFHGDWLMAAGGTNPYVGPRFPLVYLNRHAEFQPQFALGDLMSFPSVSHIDPEGNLYVGDYDWNRVLVYRQPFAAFTPPPGTPGTPFSLSTATPTPTRNTPTPTATPTAPMCGGSPSVFRFSGSAQLVSVADFSAFPSGQGAQLTIEMWVRTDTPVQRVMISKTGSGGSNQTFFVERWDQHFIVNFANFNSVAVTTDDSIPLGQWFHFALVFDGTGTTNTERLQIFVNGVSQPFSVLNGPIPTGLVDSAAPLEIGACSARDSYLPGMIDEVLLYDTALSPEAIQARYGSGAGTCVNDGGHLLAGYHLDELGGTVVSDFSGNERNGTVHGTPLRIPGGVCCAPTPTTATPTSTPTPTIAPTSPLTPTIPYATPTPTSACNGSAPIDKASLTISGNLDPRGDESVRAHGLVHVSNLNPAIDPILTGFTLRIADHDGNVLYQRTIPGGLAENARASGWQANSLRTRFIFRDREGSLGGGVSQLIISDLRSAAPGRYAFKLKGRGDFQVPLEAVPLQLIAVFGSDTQAASGQCGVRTFNPDTGDSPRCQVMRRGSQVRCR